MIYNPTSEQSVITDSTRPSYLNYYPKGFTANDFMYKNITNVAQHSSSDTNSSKTSHSSDSSSSFTDPLKPNATNLIYSNGVGESIKVGADNEVFLINQTFSPAQTSNLNQIVPVV